MICKHGKEQRETYNREAHPVLKAVVAYIDGLSAVLYYTLGKKMGHPEVTVTSFYRPPKPGHPSFHSKYQALDVRTNDRPFIWKQTIIDHLKKLQEIDHRIQFVLEDKGNWNEHLHIEFDTGDPV